MATITPLQDLPIPEQSDIPNVPLHVSNLALALEKRLVGVYATSTDRDTRNSSPQEGQLAVLKNTNKITWYDGSAWLEVYPNASAEITSGTTVPANSSGTDGDVFLKV